MNPAAFIGLVALSSLVNVAWHRDTASTIILLIFVACVLVYLGVVSRDKR